jgi:hypothetical protein
MERCEHGSFSMNNPQVDGPAMDMPQVRKLIVDARMAERMKTRSRRPLLSRYEFLLEAVCSIARTTAKAVSMILTLQSRRIAPA